MCLITKRRNPRIAQKDIIIYKVVRVDPNYLGLGCTRLVAPIRGMFCYDLGKLYEEVRFSTHEPFPTSIIRSNNAARGLLPIKWEVRYGFHSFRTKKSAIALTQTLSMGGYNGSGYTVVRGIVPAGSQYYNGDADDLCSDKIKLEKIVA